MLPEKALKKLEDRKKEHTYRTLQNSSYLSIDFASNDYLGLSRKARLESFNCINYGATGSRLISGDMLSMSELEEQLAIFYGNQASLLFGSGYQANVGLLSSVPQNGDLVLYDEQCHASLRDGMRLSYADKQAYSHNDFTCLENILSSKKYEDAFIVTEGLFSMDGDSPDINILSKIAKKHNAYIIIDESHAVGIKGETGKGLCEDMQDRSSLMACTYGFGKALGAQGGAVVSSKILKEYLINFARTFVFSTASSMGNISLLAHQQNMMEKEGELLRKSLYENIKLYLSYCKFIKGFSCLDSPIQFYKASTEELKEKQIILKENNIFCKAIYSPTVAKGEERFRINLHSYNTEEEIRMLMKILQA